MAWRTTAIRRFPPPRPSVNSVLHHSIQIDKEVGAKFDVLPYPEDNPNHLVCRISSTNHVPLTLFDSGLVGMTDLRSFHAVVDCWWDEQTSTLKGKVGVAFSGGQPAVGTHILYYDPDDFDPNNLDFPVWQRLETDNQGQFSLVGLKPKDYVFRPAGSGWDFFGVPKKISLGAGNNNVTFVAMKETYTDLPPAVKEPFHLFPVGIVDPNTMLDKTQLEAAAWQVLVERLISWDTNMQVGEAGVKNNTM